MDLNVKVAVRCRPMSSKETARGCNNIISMTPSSVHIKAVESSHEDKDFTFDHCYFTDSQQTDVYRDLGSPIVQQALDGFNGTIFAYGQTGSGKSFSMMGTDEVKGIIPQVTYYPTTL
ncbi:P-loop containing nucleoside triphosphate hydrolase protein [Ochromonadaceae sp. CCMP2298]|nr:P-loop containing nucleoside triphosphate hydrolase protein [Ochromonadaceae sp. CCMP2298]